MYQSVREMLIPVAKVLLYIEEHGQELSSLGFETEQMRASAQKLSQNGSISGDCLNKILGVFTSEFVISKCC